MNRTVLAIAMALFAVTTFFSPAAKACISCEYVPPVVNTPVYSHGAKQRTYKKRSHTVQKRQRVKKHIAKTPSVKKIDRSETAVIEPVKKPDSVETAAIKKDEPVAENSSITTAAATEPVEIKETGTDEAQAVNSGGCKKFFASVGMTLTVPCQ